MSMFVTSKLELDLKKAKTIKAVVRVELENVLLELLEKSDTLHEAVFVFKKIKSEMTIRATAIKIFERLLTKKLYKSSAVKECFDLFTTFYKEKDLLGFRTLVYEKSLALAKNTADQALAVVIARGETFGEINDISRCIER